MQPRLRPQALAHSYLRQNRRADETLSTVPNVCEFPRYNMKCRVENRTLLGLFHAVSRFPLHFMSYRGNLDYFLDSVVVAITPPGKLSQQVFSPIRICVIPVFPQMLVIYLEYPNTHDSTKFRKCFMSLNFFLKCKENCPDLLGYILIGVSAPFCVGFFGVTKFHS